MTPCTAPRVGSRRGAGAGIPPLVWWSCPAVLPEGAPVVVLLLSVPSRFIDKIRPAWYNRVSASSVREEVRTLEYLLSLLISVVAGVISYYLCKWFDRK